MISIICKSRRPELWLNFYDQFFTTKVDFEIIFIGPFKPRSKLPKQCRFIHTIVKPSQCAEIGYLSAKGDYIMEIGDDLVIKNSKPLEIIQKKIEKQKNIFFLMSHQAISYGDKLIKPHKEYNNLVIPFSPIISKKIFNLAKGIDSNFIAVMYEVDLYLRMMQKGCKVIFSGLTFYERKRSLLEPTLFGDYSNLDKKYFYSIWKVNEVFNFNSKRKVKYFKKNNLLSVSQHPQGKWSYKSFILFYLMQSNFKNRILKIFRLDFPLFHRIYYSNKNNFLIKRLSRVIKYLFY